MGPLSSYTLSRDCFLNKIIPAVVVNKIFLKFQRIEVLREVYEKVEDIDLLAGVWVEKPIPGGFVPPTFYCLVIEQLKRNTASDRHWYERAERPNAFTYGK